MQSTEARAVESATAIREQSERLIRAHAHRLVAGHPALRGLSPEQIRAELLTLAEKIAVGELHADELAAVSLPHLTDVDNAPALFEGLCESVSERHRFLTDPDEWLVAHDQPLGSRTWERFDESTQSDVDFSLDALMGVRRAVRR